MNQSANPEKVCKRLFLENEGLQVTYKIGVG